MLFCYAMRFPVMLTQLVTMPVKISRDGGIL